MEENRYYYLNCVIVHSDTSLSIQSCVRSNIYYLKISKKNAKLFKSTNKRVNKYTTLFFSVIAVAPTIWQIYDFCSTANTLLTKFDCQFKAQLLILE
jgi:hypothetical protein